MAKHFDNYEVHGCKDFFAHAKNDGSRYKYTEQVDDSEATFWTLYGHITGEGVQAIGDFKTRAAAEEVMALIKGERPPVFKHDYEKREASAPHPCKQRVVIEVSGGVAYVAEAPFNTEVFIKDYDNPDTAEGYIAEPVMVTFG